MKKETFHKVIKNRIKALFKALISEKRVVCGVNLNLSKKQRHLAISTITLLLIAVLPYVNAQPSSNAYTVRTVNVFPTNVEAVGWKNIETLSFQNLSEYALIQEFNHINSATLDISDLEKSSNSKADTSDSDSQSQSNEPVDDFIEDEITTTKQETNVEFGIASSTFDVEPELGSSGSETQTTTTDNTAIPDNKVEDGGDETEDTIVDVATTTVMRKVESLFTLALSSVTSLFDTASSAEESALKLPGDDLKETTVQISVGETEGLSTSTNSSEEENAESSDYEQLSNTDTLTDIDTNGQSSFLPLTTSLIQSTDPDVTIVKPEIAPPVTEETDDSVESVSTDKEIVLEHETGDLAEPTVVPCSENCASHTITLSDFGYPLGEGVEISGAQLRLSFASKKKPTREHIPMFNVKYSVNGGQAWSQGGSIVIDEEVSNSINGGYFLFALPEVVNQQTFDSLSVELSYDDDYEVVEDLFVESAWLELFTLEPPEGEVPTDFFELLQADGYDDSILKGDKLILPNGEEIDFKFTDKNDGETLIIKSDENVYSGLSEVTTYFSVTNTSDSVDDFAVQTYFPDGVGEVRSLELFNQNKPRIATIPEYRPFVYNCEDGWEYAGEYIPSSLDELSRQLVVPTTKAGAEETVISETNSQQETADTNISTGTVDVLPEVDFGVSTDTTDLPYSDIEGETDNTTTTVLNLLPNLSELLQFSATNSTAETNISPEHSGVNEEVVTDEISGESEYEGELVPAYSCRNTNVVRKCDLLDGANTACQVNQVKVREHVIKKYAPGWDEEPVDEGEMPESDSFLKKIADFVGFGPDKKEVPDRFEVRTHTTDTYQIQPGETKYFKMEISFPPFTSGEYWIEAIGDSEYGLLDPFWSSQWQYRIPILVDNTNGKTDLTEQQVFFEIDSALSDFWANVNSDGSDIRFVQETSVGNLYPGNGPQFENAFNVNWGGRLAIVIASTSVSSGVSDFPVFVDLSTLGSYFWNGVTSDGRDIRVTKSDGATEVPHDLVEIDATAETGELHFLAGNLSSVSDNVFHIYFDNPSATAYASTSQYGSQAVWSNYEAVYHFSDDPTAINNIITDETGNGQELQVEVASLATTTGAMGTALDLRGSSGILRDVGDDWALPGGDDLVSTGLYYQTANSAEALWQWGTNNAPNWASYMPWYLNAAASGRGYLYFGLNQNTTWSRDINVWHHFTTIAPANIGGFHGIYDNAVAELSGIQNVANPSNTGGLQVGRYTTGGSYEGIIDELRFAFEDAPFTSGWIATEHLNQTNPTAFYSTSTSRLTGGDSMSGWYSTSWDSRQKITLQASSDIADFPVYVDLSTLGDAFFADVASDGRDIRVTMADSKTELPFELVNINTGAKTGELYFKTDLTSTEDKDYYIYFNNSDATAYAKTATYGAQNVWTNGFQAVYHLEGSAVGTGNPNVYKDSTANNYHGDDENTSNGKYGRLGSGQEFGDSQTDYISLPYQVMNGLGDNSVSWWHISSSSGDQTILSGANSTQFNEFWERFDNDVNLIVYSQGAGETFGLADTVVNYNNGNWQHYITTSEDSIDEMNIYVNGVGDTENPDPQPIAPLNIENGGLIVGQDQDSLGGGFSATENFEGFLDELRIASVVRSASWAATEYNNQASPESFYSTSSVESLNVTQFKELDFWVQHFDSVNEETDIWVQVDSVPAGQKTLIYMYYGNSGASSASDELATFSYSTSTDLYYVVDDSGGTQVSVESLMDNNEVAIDGGTPISLNQGEITTFVTFTGASVVSALGPISGTVTGSGTDGSDMIAPVSFASTSFAIPTNRNTNRWYMYSPFASTTVRTYIAASASADETHNISTSSVATSNTDLPNSGQGVDGDGIVIESTYPILVVHRSTNPGDGLVAYPPTTRDLFGVMSNFMHLSALTSNSDPTASCSTGAGGTVTGITRGDHEADASCSSSAEGAGSAVRFSAQASPISAIQQADSDGTDSSVFWPQHEFGTRYALTNTGAYIAVVCSPRFGTSTIEIQDSVGGLIESANCVPGSTKPGKAYFTNGTGNGDSANFAAGTQVVATNGVPFYVMYEDVSDDNDEKNISGPVQGRKFGAENLSYLFGEQELAIDAEWEQLSYWWYQNGGGLTPTTTWMIGSEGVTEGEAITGAGAVGNGDILRLRISLEASNATGSVDTNSFALQYGVGNSGQCSLVTDWLPLGEQGSSTAVFSGYNNSGVSDGATLSTLKLASSTVAGTYEERSPSDFLPNDVPVGGVVEHDWVIEATNVAVNTNYCFRITRVQGTELETYTLYPELETVGPPNTPTLFSFFDNERTTVLTPVLEFSAIDIAGDDIDYRVQIDDNYDFSSVIIDRNSATHFTQFSNTVTPSDKSPFNSGDRIQFTGSTQLSPTTTYYWRVRANDPNGSATSSDWSTVFSFTTDTVITVSEWFQTTDDQFNTNTNSGVSVGGGSVSVASSPGTMIGTAVDFDDAVIGNAWGEADWNDTETSGEIKYQVQYNDNGNWNLVPDSIIPGNSLGTSTGPISLLELDTAIYNEIRLVATLTGATLSIQDWVVRWGLRVETPTQGDLFDNQKTSATTPVFDFISTDPQGDDLEYEISFSTDINFLTGSTTYNSSTSAQFNNAESGGDTSPFNTGEQINFTTPGGSPFVDGVTYWWKTRARDPYGGNAWSPWSTPDSFTIDTAVTLSTWFQTTRDQFNQGFLDGTVASTTNSVEITDEIGEYGSTTITDNNWVTVSTQREYKNMVVIASPEYAAPTYNVGRTARVRNKTADSFEVKVDDYNGISGGVTTVVDYIVFEAGSWTLDDGASGLQVVAGTEEGVTEIITDNYGTSNNGRTVSFSPTFGSAPAVFATLASNNDSTWAGVHVDGGSSNTEVTGSSLRVALAKSMSGLSHSGGEDIDYLLISTGSGSNNGTAMQILNTGALVDDTQSNGGYNQSISGFSVAPQTTIVQNNAENGGNGAFVFKDLSGSQTSANLFLSAIEIGAGANAHGGQEVASVFALESSSGVITRLNGGNLTGTFIGEDIIFSDGAGPKFDNFSWNATTPGASTVNIKMQYQVSEGVYALIPNSQIPGNSAGTTTTPIDLTGVDINLYPVIRAYATLSCASGNCPTLDDWKLEWSEGVNMSGTLKEYDRLTNVATGTIRAAVNGAPVAGSATVASGLWTLPNVTAFNGDVITVWVDGGTSESEEAVSVFVYDGLGDITGVELFEQHLSISADEESTVTNTSLASYDNTVSADEDIFIDVDAFGNLRVCSVGSCSEANIYIGPGNKYVPSVAPAVSINAHDFVNDGTIELDSNTINISGSWDNNATSSTDISTINLTAATGTESISSTETPLKFHNLSFGSGAGDATFTIPNALDLSGNLTVASGTFNRASHKINLAGSLTNGAGGYWLGTATTTFDGAVGLTWTDNNPVPQNVGDVVIDGASAFVSITTDVSAYDITIGGNDTLAGGTGNTIYVGGDWTNNGTFNAGTSNVEIVNDDRTYPPVIPGSADWYADTNFLDRIPVIIDNNEVPGDLTNFPVYIDLSLLGEDFWNSVTSNGRDIRVTSGNGQTELPYDLVEFDSVSKTGELHFLAGSISSSATTTFFIYHNNTSASAYGIGDTYGRNAVWTGYEAVYHFKDDPTVVGFNITDATGNGKDLQVQTEALATTTGKLGTAIDFTGTANGYLLDSDWTWTAGDRLESSGWYQMSAASSEALWSWGTGTAFNFMPWYSGATTGYHRFGSANGAFTFDFGPRDTVNWQHFTTLGATSTSEQVYTYVNTILRDSPTQLTANPTDSGLQIGRYTTAGSITALVDELRFATTKRSTDWIETEYNNQNSPEIFFATSSVQTYQPDQIIDEATHNIDSGGSSFYKLTFNDATTSPAFTEPSVVVNNNFTIATGTVSLPTGILTVGGSFLNSGYFMHNNAQVKFTAGSNASVTLNGTEFFNTLYNVTFAGAGNFTFTDINATSSNDFVINNGNVTLPGGILTIGGTLTTTGGGFNANGGTVVFSSQANENVTTKGSSFNNVIFGLENSSAGWYGVDWGERIAINVASTAVSSDLVDFPVYVNLSNLGTEFWSGVATDGRDIRMTTSGGKTEIPVEIVEFDYITKTGELHFLAPSLSSEVDTTFYLYFDNVDAVAPAVDSTYGAEAVWVNYEAVYHFNEDPTLGVSDVSGHDKDLLPLVGTPSTTPGLLGTAIDLTTSNVMMGDSDWTWTAGEDLISSGLYFMTAVDTGALWEWSNACNNDNCMAFMPWYSGDIGYHRFGETTGNDYTFTRNNTIWHHFTTIGRAANGEPVEIYEDNILRDTYTQTATGQNPGLTGLQIGRYTGGTYMDIDIDELRFSTTTPSTGWVTTEYKNLTDVNNFYSTSTQSYLDVVPSFTLNEATSDADGDVSIYYSNLVAPTNNFTIGGSALNVEGSFNANNATTTFDSNDTGETVEFGEQAFHNLSFNGVGGGWTIATTTVNNNASLVTGASFTLATNTTMTVSGRFKNQFNSVATTWSGSTLVLTGGDYTVTGRLDSGDDYATLVVSGDSDLIIWNSSISTSSIKDTSSLYMPDFSGTPGILRIYGSYERTSGTEYWSYDTDFDGTDLTGGGERVAQVEVGRGASIYLGTSTTLEAKGVPGSTTTVSAVTGIYSLNVNAGTLDAEYASFQNVGPKGLYLTNGTTVTSLTSVDFAVSGGRSGMTVDVATMNAQPSSEFTGMTFGTSTSNGIYEPEWSDQVVLTIQSGIINEDHIEYPVYVDLSLLGDVFWSNVKADGGDIRVTTDNGSELPIDLVEINTSAKTGELYFLAPKILANTDKVFYIHFNNPSATKYSNSDEFGANQVWINYEAVYHFNEDPTVSITDMTGNGRSLVPTIGSMSTTSGLLGTALDTTGGNTRLENPSWTWTSGEDLISSGLYFMTGNDTGALWQFGVGNGTNNGTYLTFLPWYNTATRGYHYFGITTGGDYDFARDNGIWHHFTTIGRAADGATNEFYEDNVLRDTVTQITSSANPSNTGLRVGAYQTTTYLDINIDELRFATSTPSTNWINTEYLNFTNPQAFYSTSTAQTVTYNVTAEGVPSTFWLFSGGSGSIYGEAFDNDDGDPGSIQWDDSNFAVTISGIVYSDDGVMPETYPVCNASTEVVTVVLDGVTTYTAPCDPIDGSFEVTGISYVGEPQITTYLNSEATESQTNVSIYDEVTGNGVTAGNIMTVSRPSTVDGAVLVLIAGKDDDINFGTPAGWTAVDILGNTTGDDIATGIWYRVVADASSEPATYDFPIVDNGEGFSYWMGSLLNVDTGTPVDVASAWTKYQDVTNPDALEVTTVTNGALVLSAWYAYIDNEVIPPVYNWDTRASNILDSAINNLTVSSRSMITAGATGDAKLDGVFATRESQTGQFAFRPASSPTATGSITAVAVTKTPIGNTGSPYETVELRDQTTGFGTVNAGANITIDRPVVENGDVLVVILGKEDDFSVTPSAGWVLGADRLESIGNQMYTAIWYKVITNAGGEPVNYSFVNNDTTVEEYSYWIGSFSGVDVTGVFDVAPAWSNLQNTSSPSAPSLTTAHNGAYVLSAWYVIDDSAMDMPGSPWTTHAQDLVQANRLLAVAGRSMPSAGATGAATLTGGSVDDVNVGQFALRPAPISVASNISDMNLYKDRVIVRHEDITPLSIADMSIFDNDDESDLPFTASIGSSDLLTVNSGTGLVVWNNRTFDSGGEIDLTGSGSTLADGSLLIKSSGSLLASGSNDITIGGSLYLESGASFSGASSTVSFTATNPGQSIGSQASSTVTLYDIAFGGIGGGWAIQTPLVSQTKITVSTGTVSGVANVTVNNGSFSGDGLVNMSGGTTQVKKTNKLGGTQGWTFNNLTLGSAGVAGVTTPASLATTSVRGVLTVSSAHFFSPYGSVWDLQGNGNVFVENGTFIEGTSTIRYSGATPNIKQTPYYNLTVDTDRGGSVVATAPVTGLQILNNLTVGILGTSTLNANTNDPVLAVGENLRIGTLGLIEASNSKTMTVNGNWNNDGVFNANGGVVTLSNTAGASTISAGVSPFATLNVAGSANYTFDESATTTGPLTINTTSFTLNPGLTLAVGGTFTNSMADVNTTWTGSTLSLYSGTAFPINTKSTGDTYNTIITGNGTHPRLWNSTTSAIVTNGVSSLYSMNHKGVKGDLYIFGDYVNDGFNDYWSYGEDFDGSALAIKRKANVRIEAGGSVLYPSGSLYIIGSSTASTTIYTQTPGTYQFTVGGDTETEMSYYTFRDTTIDGLTFTGAPNVIDLSNGDFEVAIADGSTMTVGGTVISANPAMEFNYIKMATTTPINAYNVTATGTSNSAWRFVNVYGNLGGEAKDVDPGGDPGYITWQDSAAIINISGNVYSDEGVSVSHACDSTTPNIYLSINGSTYATTTCNGDGAGGGTGAYSFTGINYGLGNTLTVYIDNEPEKAVTVTQDPVSSISNFDLYENRVIIKHEGAVAMKIADMETWDSDDDPDVLFDAEIGATDTLVLPPDTKLIVWDNKKFTPDGHVTIPGGGSGSAYDGTFELRPGATFNGGSNEIYTIGGSLISGASAVFDPGQSTTTFTTSGAGRTVDTNGGGFYSLSFTGVGSWTVSDTELLVGGDLTIANGAVTLPPATTTIAGSLSNTGGTFDSNGGLLKFTASDAGNKVRFGGSDATTVLFSGGASGSWTMLDVNATATDSFRVATGTVTLPSGILVVGDDFIVDDAVTHNGGTVNVTGAGGANLVTLSGNDLSSLIVEAGAGDYTLTDTSAAFLGDLLVQSGGFTVGAGTVSVGGSFDATGGTFTHSNGTLLFNSSDTGETIDPGANDLYNVVIAGAGGGWTVVDNATTTNNFTLSLGNSFTQSTGTRLYVGGVFTNNVGGTATEWIGSTLVLDSGTEYETNVKTTPTERYNKIVIGNNTDVSSWNASATSSTVSLSGSWYSQDHGGSNGKLNIYGDYHIPVTTEYWSRATDFDGVALGGSPRNVSVTVASSSTITLDGGTLNIIGIANGTSTITNQGAGTYNFVVKSGTFNANYYSFRNLGTSGLQFTNNAHITSISYGDFEQGLNSSVLISLSSSTLNANASLIINNTRFADGGFTPGTNVSLDATTTNSWSFTGAIGDLWGEAFDIDGTDDCSSVRWDDSQCLLTEQTTYRWRNDDGGEGAPSGTWFDSNWSSRQRVRVINTEASAYTDVAVKLDIAYDSDMQTDFDDLRFTDATGVTEIGYWKERYTTGDEADVWVRIPTMATSSVTEIYMYYGNVSANTTSDISNVFTAYDNFDDNNITEYSGDTTKLATAGTFAYGGGFGLDASPNPNDKTNNGIARFDMTVAQGDIIRYMQYIDTTAGSGDEVCTMFGVQSPVTAHQNYAVCLEQFGTDRVSLVKNVHNTDSTGTVLASSTISFSTGWYEVEIDWQTNNNIDVEVYTSAGTLVATTSATDSTYTSGGIGFTFWFQNGGWDSYVAWPRTDKKPTVHFGAEQQAGGASWASPQNTLGSGFVYDETARLRIGIENTGLPIVNQNFRLEFAPKLSAPSCQAVSGGSFVQVPVLSSCGSSAICMTTSASTTNGDPTTDHLVTDAGPFVAGEIVSDTSNQTSNIDVDQNKYTELEYAIKLTTNATNDSYCFRVTDGGNILDSYALLPELSLEFDPVLDPIVLNGGFDIALTPGATTTVVATTTVTDYNGYTDLQSATTTFYRKTVGASCTPDNNNCYIASSTDCVFSACAGSSCTLTCSADFQFHADATDADGGEEWFAFMEVSDTGGANDFGTSPGVELLTLRALDVQNAIGYGTLDINQNTGTFNPLTSLLNFGNEAIDVQISGTDMTDGIASIIPAAKQVFATSTFDYSACASCNSLSVTGADVEVDLSKPLVDNPPVADNIYWGVEVPFGTASHPHSGVNTFTAIAD